MRTNARMNRFEHCSEPKQRATISAHLHTCIRMYAPIFCLCPFIVWSPLAPMRAR